jgi:signal transduction histidine kinase
LSGAVRVEADDKQLGQVFLNLLLNAAQAIEGPGEIRIRTWRDGDTIRISISDSGRGIPADLASKIFDPGFTTKKAGQGTGLGLSISSKIVQAHGGRIELEGGAGRGGRFPSESITIFLTVGLCLFQSSSLAGTANSPYLSFLKDAGTAASRSASSLR